MSHRGRRDPKRILCPSLQPHRGAFDHFFMKLRPFQREFVAGVLRPGTKRAALSIPRGNGKSWLAGCLGADALVPGGALFEAGAENVLLSGSFDQARYVFRFTKGFLGEAGYSYLDSTNKLAIRHKATGTRLLVRSSRAKGAFGIVGARIVIADEPGSFDTIAGEMMNDALDTAIGKPGTDLKIVYIGTLSPSRGGWWHDLIADGSNGSTFVQALQGDLKKWDQWAEIRRVNPLVEISAEFRKTLLEERDKARRDSRLRARFCSYRLNRPTGDESSMLLTVEDFEAMTKRPVPPREGQPAIALDLGGSRAWSAAVALYRNGRVECRAVSPGLPGLGAQEERDNVPRGTYQKLADQGVLLPAAGLRVPPAKLIVTLIKDTWGQPSSLICDRFRIDELYDAGVPCQVIPRVSRWSEASFDIRALRSKVKDGPFAVSPCSRSLLAASLAVCVVKNDDQGSTRLVKRDTNNTARDDVAAAFVLAAGLFERTSGAPGLTISRTPF